jgi:HlyD family secretion protein
MKLFPGMTAYVTIPVASVDDALKIPNAALHYRPSLAPDQIHALYERYGIPDEAGVELADARVARPDAGKPRSPAARPGRSGQPAEGDPATSAVVWKRSGGETEPVEVILGITDHAFTAATRVVVGELKEGDELVTRTIQTRSNAPTGQGARR